MTGCAVGCAITASVVRFVIRANGIVRTDSKAIQRTSKNLGKPGSSRDEATQRSLGAGACRVDEDAATIDLAASLTRERVDPLFQRACRIAAIQGDLGHESMGNAVKQDVWRPWIRRRVACKSLLPMIIANQEFLISVRSRRVQQPALYRSLVKVNENALSKLLDRRQPVSMARNWRTVDSQLNVFNVSIGAGRRCFETRESVETRNFPQTMHCHQVFDTRKIDLDRRIGPNRALKRLCVEFRRWMVGAYLRTATCKGVKLSEFRRSASVGLCAVANALKSLEYVSIGVRAKRSRDFWIESFRLPDVLDGLDARQIAGQFFNELA
ncbi:hypothetical protein X740_07970 [Mesorhizobium sp. LNHC221B00]|nr:hypothetical protein X740_07970 [Mesorhizobium sp. LNHC221B00]